MLSAVRSRKAFIRNVRPPFVSALSELCKEEMSNLEFLKPLMALVPEVELTDRRLKFQDRAVWTVSGLIVFMVLSQLPVFGVPRNLSADPFHSMRHIVASSSNSLCELGTAPILTAMLVFHFLTASRIVQVNYTVRDERALLQGAQKLLTVCLALLMSLLYVFSGMYTQSYLGFTESLLVVAQLFGAAILVMLLDEMIQKGFGIGSGVSLFTAVSVCTDLLWKLIGVQQVDTTSGGQYAGIVLAAPQLLFNRVNKFGAIYDVFFRSENGLAGLVAFAITVAVGGVVVFLYNWRVEVQVKYQKFRAQQGKYPIKLFYTSSIPLVLLGAFLANVYFYSQVVSSFLPNSLVISALGKWSIQNGQVVPVSGIAYYLSAPSSIATMIFDPFHTLFFAMFMMSMCAVISKAWIELAGLSAKGVARELKDNQMVIKGHRDTALEHELNRYIPMAASFGGMILGGMAVAIDLFGVAGAGFGLITAITVLFQYVEIVSREYGGNLAALMSEATA